VLLRENAMERTACIRTVVAAEDDVDDRMTLEEAFADVAPRTRLQFVHDGEELLDYVNHRGRFASIDEYPSPSLILLDLNMPRMGGREVLQEIKTDPRLRRIPVVMLTTSGAARDVMGSYADGVNSYIRKPATYVEWTDTVQALDRYWFGVVALPDPCLDRH
jgi:two-component system, response regulator